MVRIVNFNQGQLPQITQPTQGLDPRIMAMLLQRQNPNLGQGQNQFSGIQNALFQNALAKNRKNALIKERQRAANKPLAQQRSQFFIPVLPR